MSFPQQIRVRSSTTTFVLFLALMAVPTANAQDDLHPMMQSKVWVSAGAFFATRNLEISVAGAVNDVDLLLDVESELGIDDEPDLLTTELGWQFSERWDVALQHFRSKRNGRKILEDTIEWEDISYEAGVSVSAQTKFSITRIFFSRRFLEKGTHDLRLGAGIHWLSAEASVSGEATLDDQSTQFRNSVAKASLPIPNIGIWYRYSISDRWLLSTRLDWLSADIGKYNGEILNAAASVEYRITDHFGMGLAYQVFGIDGGIKDSGWRGDISTRFAGLNLHFSGYW